MTRMEEMKEGIRLLNEPDLDGDRILLLVQETTIVTGEDKGSTCSMVMKALVKRLNLQSLKKTLIVQSFRYTEAIDTKYVVLELLKTDGTVAHIRAYVVDRITSIAKVEVPPEIKDEFETATPWPETRFSARSPPQQS